jgi:hypothetical protein
MLKEISGIEKLNSKIFRKAFIGHHSIVLPSNFLRRYVLRQRLSWSWKSLVLKIKHVTRGKLTNSVFGMNLFNNKTFKFPTLTVG